MKTPTCVCDRPIHNGYLCHRCILRLRNMITTAPEWADQIDVVRLRLARIQPGNEGRRSSETPLPFNPAATKPAADLDNALRGLATTLGAPIDITAHRLGIVAAWLTVHITHIRTRPDAVTWFEKIEAACAAAEELTDRPPDVWYAGRCPCGKDLYPSTTARIVTCPNCAHTWSVEHRRAELLRQVRGIVATGPDIARALSTIGDRPITPEKIRKWRHLNLLTVRGMDPGPPPANLFRVGDVLDLIIKEAAKRNQAKETTP